MTAEIDNPEAGNPARKLAVTVSNAPTGTITFSLVKAGDDTPSAVNFTSTAPCTPEGAAVTCDVPDGGAGTWTFDVNVPQGHLEETRLRATFADPDVRPIDVSLILED